MHAYVPLPVNEPKAEWHLSYELLAELYVHR
jgi:hypothetical protein